MTHQLLGLTVKTLGFQRNLSNVMNSSYWTKADYRNHNLSETLGRNDDQLSGRTHGDHAVDKLANVSEAPRARAPVESAGSTKLTGSFGKRLESPVKEEGSRLVSGPKQKENILTKYQEKFGKGKPIVTTAQGKRKYFNLEPPSQCHLMRSCKMKPDPRKSYSVEDPILLNVVVFVEGYLSMDEWLNLAGVNKLLSKVLPEVSRLLKLNWKPITEHRVDYNKQKQVSMDRVDMATALALQCGLDPGKIVRTLGGEYTGEWRNVEATLEAVKSVVSISDYYHIKRILTSGCPFELQFEEPSASKFDTIRKGNQKSFNQNPDQVEKIINKEDRNNHILPLHDWVCQLGPNMRHTAQGMVMKNGKGRIVWDGTTKMSPLDIVLNEYTPIDNEPEVNFGTAKHDFYWLIYNLRISYPNTPILLALADIKACFRFPRIHPDLTGAFGFLVGNLYCLAVAMVFGSNTSAASWEPFRRAIEGLSKKFANKPLLVQKHKKFIDMVLWDLPMGQSDKPIKAFKCPLNPGVFDKFGNQINHPSRIWVDDILIAAVGVEKMKMALAAVIEAIFVVLGQPETEKRECPLAMDKWIDLVIGETQTVLGLNLNTRKLTVSIPRKYLDEILLLIHNSWHKKRKTFTAIEASRLVGKLARLAEGSTWVCYMISQFYAAIAHALMQNKYTLKNSSKEFQDLTSLIQRKNIKPGRKYNKDYEKIIRFALKKSARMVHHAPIKYNIVPSMREEIDFFEVYLKPESGIAWETPISFLIERTPFASSYGDACLDAAGGYSIDLKFWWHIKFPLEVVFKTLKYLPDNKSGKLISINVLEFVVVIIDYCAALTVILTEDVTDDPHPVLLNIADNTAAHTWTMHTCKSSKLGKLLAKLFCFLIMDSGLGINSKWIDTTHNFIADDISRLKKSQASSSKQFSFDYALLQQKYPQLKNCRFFQPSASLLSMIWGVLLQEKLPSLEQVKTLKQSGLGKLITSSGV